MQVAVYLNIYVTPFVTALLKPLQKKGCCGQAGWDKWGMKVRETGGGVVGCFESFILPLYSLLLLYTNWIHTDVHDLSFCQLCFRKSPNQWRCSNRRGKMFQFRHMESLWCYWQGKKARRSHTFLHEIVITFIIITIREFREHGVVIQSTQYSVKILI